MTFDEKNSWAFLFISIAAYAVYLVALFSGAVAGTPLPESDYAPLLLASIGAAIVAGILANIVISVTAPKSAGRRDQRDKEIQRLGDRVGYSFVTIGGVTALLLALVDADPFWIANVIYLGFVLSALLGSLTKIVVYRRGVPAW